MKALTAVAAIISIAGPVVMLSSDVFQSTLFVMIWAVASGFAMFVGLDPEGFRARPSDFLRRHKVGFIGSTLIPTGVVIDSLDNRLFGGGDWLSAVIVVLVGLALVYSDYYLVCHETSGSVGSERGDQT